ncbi:STAS domain protein [Leptospira ryugenii]|uniref:STAS domain protein n=1 Tax=Leptospira ryugenii TaxID=1917863 RepID=A0A2P2DYH1_9LEPT|nr:STAS domain-containing protein [Leptospira ryugenii]GBF49683.1 STAS domain protein [Leptospira ryugenii]
MANDLDDRIFSIQLKGALDGASSEDLYLYLESQMKIGYKRFIFNFSHVNFITSNGIGTLLKIQKNLGQDLGYCFVIYGLSKEVETVLSLLGLLKKLPIKRTLAEAEDYLRDMVRVVPKGNHTELKTPNKESLRFYFSGLPKAQDAKEVPKVSALEPIVTQETKEDALNTMKEPEAIPKQKPVTEMETLLEAKLSHLRTEIKETLSQELEKRWNWNPLSTASQTKEETIQIPSYIQTKPKKMDSFSEKIVRCEACGTKLRIKQSGLHKCPNCKIEMMVSQSGSFHYHEKFSS